MEDTLQNLCRAVPRTTGTGPPLVRSAVRCGASHSMCAGAAAKVRVDAAERPG